MKIKTIGMLSLLAIAIAGFYFASKTAHAPEKTQEKESASEEAGYDKTMQMHAQTYVDSMPKQAISDKERRGLIFIREEEKLARDVYKKLNEKWSSQVFLNISSSEQIHTDAVKALLLKYEIDDPVTYDTAGMFTDQTFTKLYEELVSRGLESYGEALTVGALIEDLDISDLQKFILETDNDDITFVYENLMNGSKNHLRAFNKQIELLNMTYTPTYITEEEFAEIINTETGNMQKN